MKKVDLSIKRNGFDAFTMKFEVPNCEIRLMEFIPLMYQLFDMIIESELKNHTGISCRKGCGECCKQLVPIIIPEAFFLNDLIDSFSHKRQVRIKARFEKILKKIETTGLSADFKNPARYLNIDDPYFNLKVNCPFLEEGTCTIYKSRPFACREYYVTTASDNCSEPYQNDVQKLKIKRNIGSMMAAFTARLYMLPPIPIPMVFLEDWVRENMNLGTKKWSGDWLFDKMISALSTLNDEEFEVTVL